MGGKHGGFLDERDMFPQAVRSVREAQMALPSLEATPKEQRGNHLARLRKWKNKPGATKYRVTFKLVNASNLGVPQKRMRVFFVGFGADQDTLWAPPSETHSSDALLLSQWASNEYWDSPKVATRHRPPHPEGVDKKIRTLVDTNYGANMVATTWF